MVRSVVLVMSSDIILSWWYPDLKSILEETHDPYSWSNKSSTWGHGYLFLMVILFRSLKLIHNLKVPFLFFATNTGAPHGDTLGLIKPVCNSSSSWICSSLSSVGAIRYEVFEIDYTPWMNSISLSISLKGAVPVTFPENFSELTNYRDAFCFFFLRLNVISITPMHNISLTKELTWFITEFKGQCFPSLCP